MPEIDIVLVSPLYEGNVGFVSRVMKNFGFSNLVLIDTCELGEEAIARAGHAYDVLKNAEHCTIEDVFSRSNIVVATTGSVSKSVCRPMRIPYFSPWELKDKIKDLDGKISILFGRENWGLSNDEVKRCDMICTIPTSPEYPILNISHAVGIICYELAHLEKGEYALATPFELSHLYRHIDQYLDIIHHPQHKRENTMIMIRRILGRANLTTREATTLHGLLRRSTWHIDPMVFREREEKKGSSTEKQEESPNEGGEHT